MFTLEKSTIEYFEFDIKGSRKKYKIPLLRYLTMDLVLEAADLGNKTEAEAMAFVMKIFDRYEPGLMGNLTGEDFGTLSQAYFNASGISMGE